MSNNREIAKKMVSWFAAHKRSWVWQEMEDAFTAILDESLKEEEDSRFYDGDIKIEKFDGAKFFKRTIK